MRFHSNSRIHQRCYTRTTLQCDQPPHEPVIQILFSVTMKQETIKNTRQHVFIYLSYFIFYINRKYTKYKLTFKKMSRKEKGLKTRENSLSRRNYSAVYVYVWLTAKAKIRRKGKNKNVYSERKLNLRRSVVMTLRISTWQSKMPEWNPPRVAKCRNTWTVAPECVSDGCQHESRGNKDKLHVQGHRRKVKNFRGLTLCPTKWIKRNSVAHDGHHEHAKRNMDEAMNGTFTRLSRGFLRSRMSSNRAHGKSQKLAFRCDFREPFSDRGKAPFAYPPHSAPSYLHAPLYLRFTVIRSGCLDVPRAPH